MPQRIQRKRTAGWKAPANTLNVTRPGRHKNQHYITSEVLREDSIFLFRVDLDVMEREEPEKYRALINEVRDADYVMCWCSLDVACHGDVWIKRANEKG